MPPSFPSARRTSKATGLLCASGTARLMRLYRAGVLTEVDDAVLADYCDSFAELARATRARRKAKIGTMAYQRLATNIHQLKLAKNPGDVRAGHHSQRPGLVSKRSRSRGRASGTTFSLKDQLMPRIDDLSNPDKPVPPLPISREQLPPGWRPISPSTRRSCRSRSNENGEARRASTGGRVGSIGLPGERTAGRFATRTRSR